MKVILNNAAVYKNGSFEKLNLIRMTDNTDVSVRTFNNCYVFPAFCDVHVHFREPGFFYKETIKTGSLAAAHGGYSDVFTMPNLSPVPDSAENFKVQTDIIERDAVINVHPFASITKGEKGEELSDFAAIAPLSAGFSDDGKGVQSEKIMRKAMEEAKKYDRIIVAHCEDNSLLCGGYINDGEYAKKYGHKGISAESEWKAIERDLALVKKIGCKYHVCHISCAKSVELIRKAKAEGVDVTCETAPHYLVLNDMCLSDEGRFKMNPPVRGETDRLALIDGIKDGTIDMIATDHAPHSAEEKSKGLKDSAFGIVGLETAFAVLYTCLVNPGVITLEYLIELMSVAPRKRFGLPETEDICVFDLESEYKINPDEFLSLGKATPFENMTVKGKNLLTICGGKAVWQY